MICAASCSEHEIGGFYVDKCSNETKQWGITSIKNRFVQGILASALFLQIEYGFELCGITICNGNDKG